ncbi:uncharacterized protein LOC129582303 [Paramacrobiotus metropolitanus]|uniref:uncharacterized protein LOC129582303 n=1 Tax=Paramacrobiotus metropolitanus TaxID=2943436 RepID=UPI002445A053|nr:uncharacterized protein LOC129582303 [Paramacrobiotus metropolitanus]
MAVLRIHNVCYLLCYFSLKFTAATDSHQSLASPSKTRGMWNLPSPLPNPPDEVDECPFCQKPIDPPIFSVSIPHGRTRKLICPAGPERPNDGLPERGKMAWGPTFARVVAAEYSATAQEERLLETSKTVDPACPDLDVLAKVKETCNGKVTSCSFKADDPSVKAGCSGRPLLVYVECHRPGGARATSVLSMTRFAA